MFIRGTGSSNMLHGTSHTSLSGKFCRLELGRHISTIGWWHHDGASLKIFLQSVDADMIAMARELLWNADWPAHAAQSLGMDDPFSYFANWICASLKAA